MTISIPRMGDGFILREFTRDDIEGLAAIEFDPTAKQFLAVPAKERQEWINSFVPETAIGWAVDVGGHLAGRASLSGRKRGYRELVIVIGQSYWGLGLGAKSPQCSYLPRSTNCRRSRWSRWSIRSTKQA